MVLDAVATAETDDRLDGVITEYLESVERGESSEPRLWLERYPEFAEELDRFFAAEQRFDCILSPLRTASIGSTVPGRGARTIDCPPLREVRDYDLLEEIGRGGMGVIYKARQRSLNRLTAVKLIRTAEWATPAERLRFRWEAEAVAALDHANIVPIYEIGEIPSGDGESLPFFSMKLIEGGNLASWRDRFRNEWKAIARLMIIVARAIEHAHERGILHRDLKPANILISASDATSASDREDGTGLTVNGTRLAPHVTDFGLAAKAHQQRGQTLVGTIVGTPSYLAPELASGNETATIASDVYALGAILYDLLTSEPPFQAATALETIQLLSTSAVRAPRKLNRSIPRDLEIICLKCLEREPKNRYRSAGKFADDLGLFLAGRSISARPVSGFTALRRLCFRQPVIAGLGAALVLSVAISLPLIVWNWRRAVQHEQVAQVNLNAASEERERANDGFKLAHTAFEDLFRMIGDADSEELTEAQALNQELLERGLKYYREFVDRRQNEPTLSRELGAAMFRIAVMTHRIKSCQEAAAAYDSTIAFLRSLVEQYPADVSLRDKLSRALSLRGKALIQLGRREEGVRSCAEAVEVWSHFHQDGGEPNADAQRSLGIALLDCGLAFQKKGDWAGALQSYCAAKATLLSNSKPTRVQSPLVHCFLNIANVQVHHHQLEEAQENIREAKRIAARLFSEFPNAEEARILLAQSCHESGKIEMQKGDLPVAHASLMQARELFEGLNRAKPRVTYYKELLGFVYTDIADVEKRLEHPADELKACEQAVQQFRELCELVGDDWSNRNSLGRAAFKLGEAYRQRKNNAAAAKSFEESLKIRRILGANRPPSLDSHISLGLTSFRLGGCLFSLKRFEESLAAYQEAIIHYQSVLRIEDRPASRKDLSSLHGNVAIIMRILSRPVDALAATEERMKLWPHRADELYDAALDFARTYDSLASRADSSPKLRRDAVSLCIQALKSALAAGMPNLDAVRTEPTFGKIRSTDEFTSLLNRP